MRPSPKRRETQRTAETFMQPNDQLTPTELADLHELAELYGVEREYIDAMYQRRHASPAALVRVLQILGTPLASAGDAPVAIRAWKQTYWQTPLEPIAIAWDDQSNHLALRSEQSRGGERFDASLTLESGEVRTWSAVLDELPTTRCEHFDGVEYVVKSCPLPEGLPPGYHQLALTLNGTAYSCTVVSAPRRAYEPDAGGQHRNWGSFLPLYALHSARSWGGGDFTNLKELAAWVGREGGEAVGTLPLLAQLLDEPFEPSPYSPASRLFWNEAYLDLEAIPEFAASEAAQAIVRSDDFVRELAELRDAALIDYRRQLALKRKILVVLAAEFLHTASATRRAAYEAFLQARPDAEHYARFRATMERRAAPWTKWPEPLQSGTIPEEAFDADVRDYHLYVQWIAAEQMQAVADSMRSAGVSLYLDLPLGVNGDGYDVWREREAFAVGAAGGCPPDVVFRNGQDWGFPPMHPTGIRNQRYRYIIAYLRHQLRHAGMLRIDHMPVFHRLFWVPEGMTAHDGVYVRYPAEELYAVFSLESHRHRTLLVGEDLGTVPPEVPSSMQRHNVQGMFVAQYALQPNPWHPLPDAPRTSVAGLNTHDMPPFAAYLTGQDVREREALGMLGDLDPQAVLAERRATVEALANHLGVGHSGERDFAGATGAELLVATLRRLSAGATRTVLLNLEDLWRETASQNIPGTNDPTSNWCRKARYSFEEFTTDERVSSLLREIGKRGSSS
ncbi:MAG: 4-alpha-glucanotransferase [Planctomycetia bacterium]|nr:4-alpha-glucanotransferase [Planctomycetia bacterium]